VLACVLSTGFGSRDDDTSTRLGQPQLRVPELEILVDVFHEDQDALFVEWAIELHTVILVADLRECNLFAAIPPLCYEANSGMSA
jgi:hypothetical protein